MMINKHFLILQRIHCKKYHPNPSLNLAKRNVNEPQGSMFFSMSSNFLLRRSEIERETELFRSMRTLLLQWIDTKTHRRKCFMHLRTLYSIAKVIACNTIIGNSTPSNVPILFKGSNFAYKREDNYRNLKLMHLKMKMD